MLSLDARCQTRGTLSKKYGWNISIFHNNTPQSFIFIKKYQHFKTAMTVQHGN